jgi:hypothetical protein
MTCTVMGCEREGQERTTTQRFGDKVLTVKVVICNTHWSSPDIRRR